MGIKQNQIIHIDQKVEAQGREIKRLVEVLEKKNDIIKELLNDRDTNEKNIFWIKATFTAGGFTLITLGAILDPLISKIFWRVLHTTEGVGYIQWFLFIVPGFVLAWVGLRGGKR